MRNSALSVLAACWLAVGASSVEGQSRERTIATFVSGREAILIDAKSDGWIGIFSRGNVDRVFSSSRCDWVENYVSRVRDSLKVPTPAGIANGERVTFEGPKLQLLLDAGSFGVDRVFTRAGSKYLVGHRDGDGLNSVSTTLSPAEFVRFQSALSTAVNAVRQMKGRKSTEDCYP